MSDKPDIVQIKMDQPNLPRQAAVASKALQIKLADNVSRGTLFRPPFVTLFRIETPLFRRDNVTFLIPTLLLRQIIPSSNLNQTNRSASADH